MKRTSVLFKSSIALLLLSLASCVNIPNSRTQTQSQSEGGQSIEPDPSSVVKYHTVETGTSSATMSASDCISEFMTYYNKDGYVGAKITIDSTRGFESLGVENVELLCGLSQGEEITKFGGLFLGQYPINFSLTSMDRSVFYNISPSLANALFYFNFFNEGRFMNENMIASKNSLYIDMSASDEPDSQYIKLGYSENYLVTYFDVTAYDVTYNFSFEYFKREDLPHRNSIIDKETFVASYIGLANHKVGPYFTHVILDGNGTVDTGRYEGDYGVRIYDYLKDVHVERFVQFQNNGYGYWFNPVSTLRSVDMRETQYKDPAYQNVESIAEDYRDRGLYTIFGTLTDGMDPYYLLSGTSSYYYDPEYVARYLVGGTTQASVQYSSNPLKIDIKVGYKARSIVFNDDGLVDAIGIYVEGQTKDEPTEGLVRFEYSQEQDNFEKKNNYSYEKLMKTSFFSDLIK